MSRRILNDISVQVGQRAIRADLGSDIFVAEQGIESRVCAGFIRQQILFPAIGRTAQRIARGAVNSYSNKVSKSLGRIALNFLCLRRIGSEDGRDISGGVFKDHVSGPRSAEVASRVRV